ncbi:hypothetical protein PV08_00862 [Exophiala spinifera]|uniref:DUF676 domain-containing protein n=1 Tax=Exophiala spinifera TaxID=91928 RepID=A0A0D2A665_9EURO|nr:uncharacterized protein PV08_00862 [Exophiala spinifera]KIW20287.1 hypothetical protein PV08_00862 [Exophiala spinifera]
MAVRSKPVPYTANPLYLMLSDLWLFARITFTWLLSAGLPSIILPLWPTKFLDELAFTPANVWAIFLHTLLIISQIVFLVSLIPLAFGLLPILYFLYIIAFVLGNQLVSVLLNGRRQHELISSNEKCVEGWPSHPNEKWVFINGVAVGRSWLQANLDRLSMIFRRPVYAIHNQTRGIIFDVLECIIQRDLNYATLDIRQAYSALTEILSDSNVHKVVLILHSQGAIEGGMVLDWLYSSVSADEIRKLEIYTFGNAANHWNAPANGGHSSGNTASNAPNGDEEKSPSQTQRLIEHIEHYANTGDYVARFGILHFRPNEAAAAAAVVVESAAATRANEENGFAGLLFKREGSGHQLNQHYLGHMFEMEGVDKGDLSEGKVKDRNAFMNSIVDVDVLTEWNTVQASPFAGKHGQQVWEFSRLWRYRNGGSP